MSRRYYSLILLIALFVLASACSRPAKQTNQTAVREPSNTAGEQTLTGRVVRIADGDTITVLDSTNTQHRIRLKGIDAPESHQAFGAQSKKNLSQMIFDTDVTVVYEKTDQYGRIVGKILLNDKDINLEQVRDGMAWHYKEFEREQSATDREVYARAEDEARNARRGLWTDASPIEPSEFRRAQRKQREDAN
jgi:endonuclease YncB( thermonuclease family)